MCRLTCTPSCVRAATSSINGGLLFMLMKSDTRIMIQFLSGWNFSLTPFRLLPIFVKDTGSGSEIYNSSTLTSRNACQDYAFL